MIDYPKCKSCQIHIGFYLAYESIRSELFADVDTLLSKYPTAIIFVTGHSLGGVLASVSALELQLKYNKVSGLYALGCPRLGD